MAAKGKTALLEGGTVALGAIISVLAGAIALTYGHLLEKTHPFSSFLLVQLGALLAFSAVYTLFNDYFVRRGFEKQVRDGINFVRLDQSIKDAGLSRWVDRFNGEDLRTAIGNSSSVLMLVLRSDHFFDASADELMMRIKRGDLRITILLPNPLNRSLMDLMSKKFSNLSGPEELARSIQRVLNVWLKGRIYDLLPDDRHNQLTVKLIDKYPLYSAYQFDQREFWYIPYHYRDNHQPTPVMIFGTGFERAAVYEDLQALIRESPVHNLAQDLEIPEGHFRDAAE